MNAPTNCSLRRSFGWIVPLIISLFLVMVSTNEIPSMSQFDSDFVAYTEYLTKFGKLHRLEDKSLLPHRLTQFTRNLKLIQDHNNAIPTPSYTLSLNHFADEIESEVSAKFSSKNTPHLNEKLKTTSLSSHILRPNKYTQEDIDHTPSSLNWISTNNPLHMAMISNPSFSGQGNCGACWAFVASHAAQAAVNIAFTSYFNTQLTSSFITTSSSPTSSTSKSSTFAKIDTLLAPALSIQELMDCDSQGYNHGCEGGDPYWALNFVLNEGLHAREIYPSYVQQVDKCVANDIDRRLAGSSSSSSADTTPTFPFFFFTSSSSSHSNSSTHNQHFDINNNYYNHQSHGSNIGVSAESDKSGQNMSERRKTLLRRSAKKTGHTPTNANNSNNNSNISNNINSNNSNNSEVTSVSHHHHTLMAEDVVSSTTGSSISSSSSSSNSGSGFHAMRYYVNTVEHLLPLFYASSISVLSHGRNTNTDTNSSVVHDKHDNPNSHSQINTNHDSSNTNTHEYSSNNSIVDTSSIDNNFNDNENYNSNNHNNLSQRKTITTTTTTTDARSPSPTLRGRFSRFLRQRLHDVGPVTVGICGTQSRFLFYAQGIFDDEQCCTVQNHAMLLVGYGEDANKAKYWLLMNSWGKFWGENGFMRILRYEDEDDEGDISVDQKSTSTSSSSDDDDDAAQNTNHRRHPFVAAPSHTNYDDHINTNNSATNTSNNRSSGDTAANNNSNNKNNNNNINNNDNNNNNNNNDGDDDTAVSNLSATNPFTTAATSFGLCGMFQNPSQAQGGFVTDTHKGLLSPSALYYFYPHVLQSAYTTTTTNGPSTHTNDDDNNNNNNNVLVSSGQEAWQRFLSLWQRLASLWQAYWQVHWRDVLLLLALGMIALSMALMMYSVCLDRLVVVPAPWPLGRKMNRSSNSSSSISGRNNNSSSSGYRKWNYDVHHHANNTNTSTNHSNNNNSSSSSSGNLMRLVGMSAAAAGGGGGGGSSKDGVYYQAIPTTEEDVSNTDDTPRSDSNNNNCNSSNGNSSNSGNSSNNKKHSKEVELHHVPTMGDTSETQQYYQQTA